MDREVQRKLVALLRQRNRDLPRGAHKVTMSQLVREWIEDDYRRLSDEALPDPCR